MAMTRTNKTTLGLERLECREMPAVTYSISGGVLTFTGDDTNTTTEFLQVRDLGRAGSGNIGYRLAPMMPYTQIPGEYWQVVINTRGGADDVRYVMPNNLAAGLYRDVVTDLGAGADMFSATIRGNITGPNGLRVVTTGGSGKDVDKIYAFMHGDVLNAGSLGLSFSGEDGDDEMIANLAAAATPDLDIGYKATVWVNMFGGAGNDTLSLSTDGEIDGRLLFHVEGGADNDNLSARLVIDPGSYGSVGDPNADNSFQGNWNRTALLFGDSGMDTLEFRCTRDSTLRFIAAASGGADQDTFIVNDSGVALPDRVLGETLTTQ